MWHVLLHDNVNTPWIAVNGCCFVTGRRLIAVNSPLAKVAVRKPSNLTRLRFFSNIQRGIRSGGSLKCQVVDMLYFQWQAAQKRAFWCASKTRNELAKGRRHAGSQSSFQSQTCQYFAAAKDYHPGTNLYMQLCFSVGILFWNARSYSYSLKYSRNWFLFNPVWAGKAYPLRKVYRYRF